MFDGGAVRVSRKGSGCCGTTAWDCRYWILRRDIATTRSRSCPGDHPRADLLRLYRRTVEGRRDHGVYRGDEEGEE